MYKVLIAFRDGENGKAWPPAKGGFSYAPGDPYPKAGFEPTKEHVAYLLGKGNRFGCPVIEPVAAEAQVGKALGEMTKNELVAYASKNEIGVGQAKNKAEILAAIEEAVRG